MIKNKIKAISFGYLVIWLIGYLRFLPDFHRDRLSLVPRSVGMTTSVISNVVRNLTIHFRLSIFSDVLPKRLYVINFPFSIFNSDAWTCVSTFNFQLNRTLSLSTWHFALISTFHFIAFHFQLIIIINFRFIIINLLLKKRTDTAPMRCSCQGV